MDLPTRARNARERSLELIDTCALSRSQQAAILGSLRKQRVSANSAIDGLIANRTLPAATGPAKAKQTWVAPDGRDAAVWLLHVRYARAHGQNDRAALVEHYSGYTIRLARRLGSSDDLRQAAFEGLLAAIDRFDPSRRRPFVAFAGPTIMGRVRRERDRLQMQVHLTHRDLRMIAEAAGVLDTDSNLPVGDVGRTPGEDRGQASAAARAAMATAGAARNTLSVDTISDEILRRCGPDDQLQLDMVDLRMTLSWAISRLPDSERDLFSWSFVEGLTQTAIAAKLGVSQMEVSRRLKRTRERLQAYLR